MSFKTNRTKHDLRKRRRAIKPQGGGKNRRLFYRNMEEADQVYRGLVRAREVDRFKALCAKTWRECEAMRRRGAE